MCREDATCSIEDRDLRGHECQAGGNETGDEGTVGSRAVRDQRERAVEKQPQQASEAAAVVCCGARIVGMRPEKQ